MNACQRYVVFRVPPPPGQSFIQMKTCSMSISDQWEREREVDIHIYQQQQQQM